MATEESAEADDAPEAYQQLLQQYRRVANLNHVKYQLQWDQQVMMPEGGTPARSEQLSTISSLEHELLVEDEVGDLLAKLAGADLTDRQQAAVREVHRDYERKDSVSSDLIHRISTASSEALEAWEQAKENDDFETFAPHLENLVELQREYAEQIDPDRDPYAVLFEEFEPCLPLDHAERILERVRETLVPLIEDIRASDADITTDVFEGTYPEDKQEELSREVLSILGYDWEHARLDVSSHPFTSGTTFDSRITTRFDEENPLDALTSTIHEYGHSLYQLGLPEEEYATPLGEARDLSVHESQSRLWENHIGRSQAFWELVLPKYSEYFPGAAGVDPREAYEAANQVYEDNLIRVQSDELTYHLHILVRFEIEQALIRGELAVEDVPEVWNDKYEEYLGIRPETDAEGCLQDIHWSHGNFGYFPTYTLGSVMSAQLFDAAEDDIGDIDAQISDGEFDPLQEWLRENVHRHGTRYETNELVRQATGEEFTADYFLDYVEEKYSELYDLDR